MGVEFFSGKQSRVRKGRGLDAVSTLGLLVLLGLLPPSTFLPLSLSFPASHWLILATSLWVKQEHMILVLRMVTKCPY